MMESTPYIVKKDFNEANPLLNTSWLLVSIPLLISVDALKRKYINRHTIPTKIIIMAINMPRLLKSENPGTIRDSALAICDCMARKKINRRPMQTNPAMERNFAHREASERLFDAVWSTCNSKMD